MSGVRTFILRGPRPPPRHRRAEPTTPSSGKSQESLRDRFNDVIDFLADKRAWNIS